MPDWKKRRSERRGSEPVRFEDYNNVIDTGQDVSNSSLRYDDIHNKNYKYASSSVKIGMEGSRGACSTDHICRENSEDEYSSHDMIKIIRKTTCRSIKLNDKDMHSYVDMNYEVDKNVSCSINTSYVSNKPALPEDVTKHDELDISSSNLELDMNKDASNLPGHLKDAQGTIVPIWRKHNQLNKYVHLVLRTEIRKQIYDFPVTAGTVYVYNGVLYKCSTIESELKVKFDAYHDKDTDGYKLSLVWIGEKPISIEKKRDRKEYFDIPGKYYELNKQHCMIAFLDNSFVPIRIMNAFNCFNDTGKRLTSRIQRNSLITMHLIKRKEYWSVIQLVVHSPCENSTLNSINWPKWFPRSLDQAFDGITKFNHNEGISAEECKPAHQNEEIKPLSMDTDSECSEFYQSNIKEVNNDIENRTFSNDQPKCLVDWQGTLSLKYENEDKNCIKHFIITTKIKEEECEIFVRREESFFENKVLKSCQQLNEKINILFDACLSSSGYYVMVMWTGDKPKYMCMENGEIRYYDVLCKYYGCNGNKHQLIAVVDGFLIPIQLNHFRKAFNNNGEEFVPTIGEFISSYLKSNERNGLVTWSVLFSCIRASAKSYDGMFWPISFSTFKLALISEKEVDTLIHKSSNTTNDINKSNKYKLDKHIEKFQLPEVLKDCDGTLFPIFCKDDPDIVEFCVLKTNIIGCSYISNIPNTNGQYMGNGVLCNFSKLDSKIEVGFDAHLTDDGNAYTKNIIWAGRKPNHVLDFYYDVPAKYYGFKEQHQILAYVNDTYVPIRMCSFKISSCYSNLSDNTITSAVVGTEQLNTCLQENQGRWKVIYCVPSMVTIECCRENINWPQSFCSFDDIISDKVSSDIFKGEKLPKLEAIVYDDPISESSGIFNVECDQDLFDLPRVLKNWPATIVPIFREDSPNVIKYYNVKFTVAGQEFYKIRNKKSFYLDNGAEKRFWDIRFEREALVDAHLKSNGTSYTNLVIHVLENCSTNDLPRYLKSWPATIVPIFTENRPIGIKYYHLKFTVAGQEFIKIRGKRSCYLENGVEKRCGDIRFEKEVQINAHLNEKESNYTNLVIHEENSSTDGLPEENSSTDDLPGYLKKWPATIVPVFKEDHPNLIDTYHINFTVAGQNFQTIKYKEFSYVENGVVKRLGDSRFEKEVLFDAVFKKIGRGYTKILVWDGEKPNMEEKMYNRFKYTKTYYDIPAKYYGFFEEHVLIAYVEDHYIPISQKFSNNFYNSSDKKVAQSIVQNSYLTMHLTRSENKWSHKLAVIHDSGEKCAAQDIEWPESYPFSRYSGKVFAENIRWSKSLMSSLSIKEKPSPIGNIENEIYCKSINGTDQMKDNNKSKKTDLKNSSILQSKPIIENNVSDACSLENKDFLGCVNYLTGMTIINGYSLGPSKLIAVLSNHTVLMRRNSFYINQKKAKSNKLLHNQICYDAKCSAIIAPIPIISICGIDITHQAIVAWQGQEPSPEDIAKHMPPILKTVDNMTIPKVLNESVCISANGEINAFINRKSLYLNGEKIEEGVNLSELVVIDSKLCGLVIPLETPVEEFGVTITHESVVTWQGVKPNTAVCNFHILNREKFDYMKLSNQQKFSQGKSMLVSENDLNNSDISKNNSFSMLDSDSFMKINLFDAQSELKQNVSIAQNGLPDENLDPNEIDNIKSDVESKVCKKSSKDYDKDASNFFEANSELFFKEIIRDNPNELDHLTYTKGSFLNIQRNIGFIKSQEITSIFHTAFLFCNGKRIDGRGLRYGEAMSSYQFPLEEKVDFGDFCVTHVAVVAFVGIRPVETDEKISYWKIVFAAYKSGVEYDCDTAESKEHTEERPYQIGYWRNAFAAYKAGVEYDCVSSECKEQQLSTVSFDSEEGINAKTSEEEIAVSKHQTHKSSEEAGMSKDEVKILPSFREILVKNPISFKNLVYLAGAFAKKEENLGFIKAPGKGIIFHMDYLYQDGKRSNKDMKSEEGIKGYGFSLDNQVNVGNFCITHIGTVIFSGTKPTDSEEIITSWINEFLPAQNILTSRGKINKLQFKEIPKNTKCLGPPKDDLQDNVHANILIDSSQISCAQISHKLKCLGSNISSYFLNMAVSSHHELRYRTGTFIKFDGPFGVLYAGQKKIIFQKSNLYINSKIYSGNIQENPIKSGKTLHSYSFPLTKTKLVGGHVVTHFGVIVFGGKKPLFVNDIISYWKENIQDAGKNIENCCSVNTEMSDNMEHINVRHQMKNDNSELECVQNTLKPNMAVRNKKKQTTSEKKCMKKAQDTSFNKEIQFGCEGEITAINFRILMESNRRSPNIYNVYNLESFVLLGDSVCILEGNEKNIAFHLDDLNVNGEKTQKPVEDLKMAKNLKVYIFELVTGKVILDGYCLTHAACFVNIDKKNEHNSVILEKSMKKSSNDFYGNDRDLLFSNKKLTSSIISLDSMECSANSGATSFEKSSNDTINDVTGKIVKVMRNSILILFNNYPTNIYQAIAQCSLSNIFLDGVRYGNTTKREIESYLYSEKYLHGMVRLSRSQYVEGIFVEYKMILAWIGRKPDKEVFMDFGRKKHNESQIMDRKEFNTIRSESSASVCTLSSTHRTKEKQIGIDQLKSSKSKNNAVPTGIISHIEPHLVEVSSKNGKYFQVTKDRCFLYNVCLQGVDLTHVLIRGLVVEYEFCESDDVKGIWLPSSSISLSSMDLYCAMTSWCDKYNIPENTRCCLLESVDWEPMDLSNLAPTVDWDDEREIVNA